MYMYLCGRLCICKLFSMMLFAYMYFLFVFLNLKTLHGDCLFDRLCISHMYTY